MSYRCEVFIEHWADQGLNFPTRKEALDYGHASKAGATYRAVQSGDPANYRFVDGKLTPYLDIFFNPYGALYVSP